MPCRCCFNPPACLHPLIGSSKYSYLQFTIRAAKLQRKWATLWKRTSLGSVFFHYDAHALKQPLQAVHSFRQSLPVLCCSQIWLALPFHRHAVANNEVAAVQRADVDGGCVSLTQAGQQLHPATDAATVHQDANRPRWSGGFTHYQILSCGLLRSQWNGWDCLWKWKEKHLILDLNLWW